VIRRWSKWYEGADPDTVESLELELATAVDTTEQRSQAGGAGGGGGEQRKHASASKWKWMARQCSVSSRWLWRNNLYPTEVITNKTMDLNIVFVFHSLTDTRVGAKAPLGRVHAFTMCWRPFLSLCRFTFFFTSARPKPFKKRFVFHLVSFTRLLFNQLDTNPIQLKATNFESHQMQLFSFAAVFVALIGKSLLPAIIIIIF
jgi:hypothetical protein